MGGYQLSRKMSNSTLLRRSTSSPEVLNTFSPIHQYVTSPVLRTFASSLLWIIFPQKATWFISSFLISLQVFISHITFSVTLPLESPSKSYKPLYTHTTQHNTHTHTHTLLPITLSPYTFLSLCSL